MDELVKPKVFSVGYDQKKVILDRIERKYGHRAELATAILGDSVYDVKIIEQILDYNFEKGMKKVNEKA
jgi:3-deoxy-D-manno-octulosonate 8-phosphate phosphatase KdsC-like HAD superfamily phosphatase